MNTTKSQTQFSHNNNHIRWMAVTAMLMAMNIALSSFGVPVPGGHLYLNDIAICTAGILLNPFDALIESSGRRTRCFSRSHHYDSWLFSGKGLYLQHPGICNPETAFPDFTGGSRCHCCHILMLPV